MRFTRCVYPGAFTWGGQNPIPDRAFSDNAAGTVSAPIERYPDVILVSAPIERYPDVILVSAPIERYPDVTLVSAPIERYPDVILVSAPIERYPDTVYRRLCKNNMHHGNKSIKIFLFFCDFLAYSAVITGRIDTYFS